MHLQNLEYVVSRYAERFDELHGKSGKMNEWGKWSAVACFRNNWDINATDFGEMFNRSVRIAVSDGLMESRSEFPIGGIKQLIKNGEADFVKSQFKHLFSDDKGDLNVRQSRIDDFVGEIKGHIERLKGPNTMFAPSVRHAIWFLAMHRPSKNFAYQYEPAHSWAECIEYADEISAGAWFSLDRYYRMCEQTLDAIRGDKRLKDCLKRKIEKPTDGDWHLLVYDLIYCAYQYGLYSGLTIVKRPERERVKLAKDAERKSELRALISQRTTEIDELKASLITSTGLIGAAVSNAARGGGRVVGFDYVGPKCCRVVVDYDGCEVAYGFPLAYQKQFLIPEGDRSTFDALAEKHDRIEKLTADYNRLLEELNRK